MQYSAHLLAKPPMLTPRLGPRPLPLHLMMALNLYTSSNAALPLLRNGSLNWSPTLETAGVKFLDALRSQGADGFAARVERLSRDRLSAFMKGVQVYRDHSYRRELEDPPVVWNKGSTRLLDYGDERRTRPIILIPSLINRHYILDLSEERSFVRWLAGEGFHPFVVDWGTPSQIERSFSVGDYIKRLDHVLDWVGDATDYPSVSVIGYCRGGMLAMGMSLRNVAKIDKLVLLATPWSFQNKGVPYVNALATLYSVLEPSIKLVEELPSDVLQICFSALDPLLVERKFVSFSEKDPGTPDAHAFVAIEDWVNDGVPLVASVARECFYDWLGRNSPAKGEWKVDGHAVNPAFFDKPTLVVVPENDRIVPPSSAIALGKTLPQVTFLEPAAGHVGMVVGRSAEKTLWKPVAKWLSTP